MTTYDPAKAPDPADWLALDEQERITLVEDQHRTACIKLPNAKLHAVLHAIVENQIAEGVQSTRQAMERLQKERLTRHDAVHAVASVLADHLFPAMQEGKAISQTELDSRLGRLTAKR